VRKVVTGDLVPQRPTLAQVSHIADRVFISKLLQDYREKKSEQTLRRQRADLSLFATYLDAAGIEPGDFYNDITAWQGMSFGILEGFKQWMLDECYSMGTINVRVATVRRYCDLAFRAGHLTEEAHALIKTVKGFTGDERRNVDEKREVTRNGHKKAIPTSITYEQAELLKAQDDPRDALLMCLLIDHGLRCGEVAGLRVENFDLSSGELKFYRHKVNKWQTHKLTTVTQEAALTYIDKTGVVTSFSKL
jgi:integrase